MYLEYRKTMPHHVIEIHEEYPASIRDGYTVAQSDLFEPGDEAEYWIYVYHDKVVDGQVMSHAAVRQGPSVRHTLDRLLAQEKANTTLTGESVTHKIATRILTKSLIHDNLLSSDEIAQLSPLYPDYTTGVGYKIGDLIVFEHNLYEVIQEHTSQEDWRPDEVPSLYELKTPDGTITEWVQPSGAHDAYPLGALVSHKENIWISVVDHNVWEPGEYGWEVHE